jgi:gamma-glutamylaminecyclotransferase
MKDKIFVYGSLKEHFHNNNILCDSKLIGKYKTKNKYAMFSEVNRRFPYVIKEIEHSNINGEVYEISSNNILKRMDNLNKVPKDYKREKIIVFNDNSKDKKEEEVWIYFSSKNINEMLKKPLEEWKIEYVNSANGYTEIQLSKFPWIKNEIIY